MLSSVPSKEQLSSFHNMFRRFKGHNTQFELNMSSEQLLKIPDVSVFILKSIFTCRILRFKCLAVLF